MKTLEELKEEPLKYPVEKWVKWRFEHDSNSNFPFANYLLSLILGEVSRLYYDLSEMAPEWEVLWGWQKQARIEYKSTGVLDTAACYIILDQAFQLSFDGNLLDIGFFDRLPD